MLSKISTPANVISEVTQKSHLTERKRKENFKGGKIVVVFKVEFGNHQNPVPGSH